MKICNKCKKEKQFIEFYKNKTKKDGLDSWCIECNRKNAEKWRKANKDKVNEYYRQRYKKDPKRIGRYVINW